MSSFQFLPDLYHFISSDIISSALHICLDHSPRTWAVHRWQIRGPRSRRDEGSMRRKTILCFSSLRRLSIPMRSRTSGVFYRIEGRCATATREQDFWHLHEACKSVSYPLATNQFTKRPRVLTYSSDRDAKMLHDGALWMLSDTFFRHFSNYDGFRGQNQDFPPRWSIVICDPSARIGLIEWNSREPS